MTPGGPLPGVPALRSDRPGCVPRARDLRIAGPRRVRGPCRTPRRRRWLRVGWGAAHAFPRGGCASGCAQAGGQVCSWVAAHGAFAADDPERHCAPGGCPNLSPPSSRLPGAPGVSARPTPAGAPRTPGFRHGRPQPEPHIPRGFGMATPAGAPRTPAPGDPETAGPPTPPTPRPRPPTRVIMGRPQRRSPLHPAAQSPATCGVGPRCTQPRNPQPRVVSAYPRSPRNTQPRAAPAPSPGDARRWPACLGHRASIAPDPLG